MMENIITSIWDEIIVRFEVKMEEKWMPGKILPHAQFFFFFYVIISENEEFFSFSHLFSQIEVENTALVS